MFKKLIKKFLYKKKWLHQSDIYKELRQDNILNFFLNFFLNCKNKINIIQIGANDGKTNDPIYESLEKFKEKINLICFEPQKEAFSRLKENYKNFKNVTLINKAIGKHGNQNFYYIDQSELKKNFYHQNLKFSDGINSFEKKNLEKRLFNKGIKKDLDRFIKKTLIETINLKKALDDIEILEKGKNLDLLLIDCEGYDDQVLYNADLEFFNPKLIYFEQKNLEDERKRSLLEFLNNRDYFNHTVSKTDVIAVKKNIF